MTTIGIIGSGHVGSSLARAAIAHGYDVVLSTSKGPDSLGGLVRELGPHARAPTSASARVMTDESAVAWRNAAHSSPAAETGERALVHDPGAFRADAAPNAPGS